MKFLAVVQILDSDNAFNIIGNNSSAILANGYRDEIVGVVFEGRPTRPRNWPTSTRSWPHSKDWQRSFEQPVCTDGRLGRYLLAQRKRLAVIRGSGQASFDTSPPQRGTKAGTLTSSLLLAKIIFPDICGSTQRRGTFRSFLWGNGISTVPVEISPTGIPSMQDPATDPSIFKQALNGYESAKLGLRIERSIYESDFCGHHRFDLPIRSNVCR